jgi:hypothetical protein
MLIENHPKKVPLLFGTCPKCHTSYGLTGTAPLAGVLCPNCREKGYTIVGVIHFEPKKPTLRKAAEALLKHILENSVCDESCNDGDGHIDQWSSPELESLTDELKRALKQ